MSTKLRYWANLVGIDGTTHTRAVTLNHGEMHQVEEWHLNYARQNGLPSIVPDPLQNPLSNTFALEHALADAPAGFEPDLGRCEFMPIRLAS